MTEETDAAGNEQENGNRGNVGEVIVNKVLDDTLLKIPRLTAKLGITLGAGFCQA